MTHLPLVGVVGPDVAGLHEQAAVDAAVVEPLRAAGERAGLQQADVLLPPLEGVEGVRLVVRGDDALDEPLRLRVMRAAAVSASTGRLNARMPPNAESGSPSHARWKASASVGGDGRPARVVVLDDDGRRGRRTSRPRSGVEARPRIAIVKKIMEEHGGTVELLAGEAGGALVRLSFPVRGQ